MTKELRTERLLLKVLDETDADKVLDFVTANRTFLAEWEVLRSEEYYTADYHKQLLRDDHGNMLQGQLFKVWLCKQEEPGRIIGSVSLSNIVRGPFQSCHLGYRMDGREQGKGYMTEAVGAIVRYAFETLKLHRIEANIMPRNHASLRIAHKAGFYHEGLAVKYLMINGVWEDHIHMVIRNEALE